jgi:putative ABC transport system permease protein
MLHDLRYAVRLLRKAPGFTIVAVLTLALGIGTNTAVFSIVNGTLLRPLPYRQPESLVAIWDRQPHESSLAKIFDSFTDFLEYQQHARSFEELAVTTWDLPRGTALTGRGPARNVLAIAVTDSIFALLGVRAQYGRTFLPEDVGRGCSVVLSNSLWSGSLGGDPKLVGQSLVLNNEPCTVVGVMPPDFAFYPKQTELWRLLPPVYSGNVGIFGRLKPGVSRERAQAELISLHDALHRSDGEERNIEPAVYDLHGEFTWMAGRNLRSTLWILLGAVAMVLSIACLNVANLLLGRSFLRSREFAVRAALGGGRARLLRQLLTEGLVLSTLGGACGIAVAFGALQYFRSVNPIELPVGARVEISAPVLAFTLALACLTAVVFGLAPAYVGQAFSLSRAVRRTAPRGRALVAVEVALSVLLLTAAGLLIESIAHIGSVPLGFQPDRVFDARLSLPADGYAEPGSRARFSDALTSRVAAIPGVEDVAVASQLPPAGGGQYVLQIFGRTVPPDRALHDVASRTVSPSYFRTLGVALRRGRLFDKRDRRDTEPVVVIDEALAAEYFPQSDPLGQKIRVESRTSKPWATVIGVVGTEKRTIVYQEMGFIERAGIYVPFAQDPPATFSIAVRMSAGAGIPSGAIRSELAKLDGTLGLGPLESLRKQIEAQFAYPRFRAVILGAFAVFALLLAAVGLHGVLSQFVSQRTREIGVRLALGAKSRDVIRLVANQGGAPVVIGVALGLILALALGRFLGSVLYGVQPRDPLTLFAVCVILVITAAFAIVSPARRAARTDPMDALRQE